MNYEVAGSRPSGIVLPAFRQISAVQLWEFPVGESQLVSHPPMLGLVLKEASQETPMVDGKNVVVT